jgi:predicted dehydrogenase
MSDSMASSRRSFLQSTSAIAGAAALASSIGSRAYAAGDDKIKIALVGCGGRGTGAATQCLSTTNGLVELYAMADAFEDAIDKSLMNLKGEGKRKGAVDPSKVNVTNERKFVGLDAYKKAIDCGVDMVILATPPGFRPMQFEYAVKQGKNIFMEKPVATDAAGVRRVLEAAKIAKEKNLKVGVGLQRHHSHLYQETIKRLWEGAIGDINHMRVYWNSDGVWDPRLDRDKAKSEMEYQVRNWYYYTWLGGDHIVEQHIHNIDVANWVLGGHSGGMAYPKQAQGMGGRQVRTDKKYGEIYDHFAIEFTYETPAGDITVQSHCRHIKHCWNSVTEYAVGTKGKASVSGGIIEPTGGEKWKFRDKEPNAYQVEHDVLQDAIRNNKPHNEAERGAKSTMSAILGRLAAYSGKIVQWDAALNSEVNYAWPQNLTWDAQPPTLPDSNGYYPVPMPGITKVV